MVSASAPAKREKSAPRRATVLARVAREARGTREFAVMTAISAAIALLGLLQSSTAVVIGAMLVSPLMAPIIGLGFGVAIFDTRLLQRSLTTLVMGVVTAIILTTVISAVSPIQIVTPEIAGRTRPNLFDLGIAVVGGLAGAYATINAKPTIMIGVAIATALMPPLAVVGFGIATRSWPIASGALFLFATNVMAITIAAAITARLNRFGSDLSPQQTLYQTLGTIVVFAIFAVPLAISLTRIAREATSTRAVSATLTELAGDDARVDALTVDYAGDPVNVRATVFAPTYRGDLGARATAAIKKEIGRPVIVTIDQLRTLSEANQAAQDRLSNALTETETRTAQARSVASAVAEGFAVPLDAVAVDPTLRVAIAHLEPDPASDQSRGVTLAELRRRFGAWQITVIAGGEVLLPFTPEPPPEPNATGPVPTAAAARVPPSGSPARSPIRRTARRGAG